MDKSPTANGSRQKKKGAIKRKGEADANISSSLEGMPADVLQTFLEWDGIEFVPGDREVDVEINSIESKVGYSSLLRQMHNAFVNRVAFYRSEAGGALSTEEARARAFCPARNAEEAIKELHTMLRLPVESLSFIDLWELYTHAPRVAERFWERIKKEAQTEFESGHLSANISFPARYMKQVWNIARYMGVRDSFIVEWQPKGGIEVAMIDMLAQSYFQWQYWLEQTVRRSETPEKQEHPEYTRWKQYRVESKSGDSTFDDRWIRPYVSDVRAVEHASQMADRFQRMFMRTLRQMRDLRRYSSTVTINNANQVNIAGNDIGQSNETK